MHQQHASPETIRLFLRSELSVEESSVLIRHLLSQCPQCLGAAGALAWRSPQPMLPPLRQASHRRGYGEAFAATERRLAVRERELARQRAVAADQWQELRRHPPLRWRWRIRAARPGAPASRPRPVLGRAVRPAPPHLVPGRRGGRLRWRSTRARRA